MRALRMSDGLPPRGSSWFWNDGEICNACELDFLSAKSVASCAVPSRDVQNEFPNTVNVRQGFGRSRGGIHVLQQLKKSRTMPRITFKSASKLLGEKRGFCFRSHVFNFSP